MDMQNVKDLIIPEGSVRTIHDSGDRLLWGKVSYSTEYDGDTVQYTTTGIQMCPNVDFDTLDGWSATTYWSAAGNSTINLNIPGSTSTFQKIYRQLPTIASHKYYLSAVLTQPEGSATSEMFLSNSPLANYPSPQINLTGSSVINKKNSGILQPTSDNASIGFMIQSSNRVTPTSATIKEVLCVDLTDKYGAGNEPTKEWCDANLSWEPYSNGTVSPNLDYPQSVRVVSGKQTVTVHGKNLFTTDNATTIGSQTVITGPNSYTATTTGNWQGRLIITMPVKSNTNMRFDWKCDGPVAGQSILSSIKGNVTNTNLVSSIYYGFYIGHPSSTAFNTGSNTAITIELYASGNSSSAGDYKMYDLSIQEGSAQSSFEVYMDKDYVVDLRTPNLFSSDTVTNGTLQPDGTVNTGATGYSTTDFIEINPLLPITKTATGSPRVKLYDSNKNAISTSQYDDIPNFNLAGTHNIVYKNAKYIRFSIYLSSYPLDGVDMRQSMEFAKSGTYKDCIYFDNGNWYVHKEVGKTKLDGSETWNTRTNYSNTLQMYTVATTDNLIHTLQYCNYAKWSSSNFNYGGVGNFGILNNTKEIMVGVPSETTVEDFKTQLAKDSLIAYYVLASPTNTQITDATLISQLDAIHQWMIRYGYYGDVSGNLPIIINRTNL